MVDTFALKKKALMPDLSNIVVGLTETSQARVRFATAWMKFADVILKVGKSQAPTLLEAFNNLRGLLIEFASIHIALADAESQTMEDMNDLIERYVAVFRADNELYEAQRKYKTAQENYQTAVNKNESEKNSPKYPQNQARLELVISNMTQRKEQAISELRTATEKACVVRQRYGEFKARRLRHAWSLYSSALSSAAESEVSVFQSIRAAFDQLRGENPEVAAEVEQQFSELPPPPLVQQPVFEAAPQIPEPESGQQIIEPEPEPEPEQPTPVVDTNDTFY